MSKKKLLTKDEEKAVKLLGQAASLYFKSLETKEYKNQPAFKKLKQKYEYDSQEFLAMTHMMQSRIMARAAARAYPKKYRIV